MANRNKRQKKKAEILSIQENGNNKKNKKMKYGQKFQKNGKQNDHFWDQFSKTEI